MGDVDGGWGMEDGDGDGNGDGDGDGDKIAIGVGPIRNEVYPGAKRLDGSEMSGLLLCDLQEHERHLLDIFEGDEYVQQPVEVDSSHMTTTATMYVFGEAHHDKLERTLWEFEIFRENHGDDCVEMCCEFRQEYLEYYSKP